jgi:hypothetical protein
MHAASHAVTGHFGGAMRATHHRQEEPMTTTTTRRRSLTRSERRAVRALAAQVWPLAIRLADRIDPAMSPAKGSVAEKLRQFAAAALQAEGRLTPARDFSAFARRFQGRRAA